MKQTIISNSAYLPDDLQMERIMLILTNEETDFKDFLLNMFYYFLRKLNFLPSIKITNVLLDREFEDECFSILEANMKFYPNTKTSEEGKLFNIYHKGLKEKDNEDKVERIMFFLIFILDIFQSKETLNPSKLMIFEDKSRKFEYDERKELFSNFFQVLISHFENSKINKHLKEKMSLKVFHLIIIELAEKVKIKNNLTKDVSNSVLDSIRFFKICIKNQIIFDSHNCKELMGIWCYYSSINSEFKAKFIDENILNDLMLIEKEKVDLNESEILETFFKFLETLCFDKEFVYSNALRAIVSYFYKKKENRFQKRVSLKTFSTKMNFVYQKNKSIFYEAFSNICNVKKAQLNSPLYIKLKKGAISIFFLTI